MTEGESFETRQNNLLDEIANNTKMALRYSRLRFLATWLIVGLLAMLTCIALILAQRNAKVNLKQTDDIARVANVSAKQASTTADAAAKQSDDTVKYLKGEQGIPGVPGANGVDGAPGQPSSQPGPEGPTGPKGDQGTPGSTGANGPSGPQGLAGIAGPLGPVGAVGPSGTNGLDGINGTQGPKGEKGDEGPRGTEGPTGPQGPQGPQGPPGDPHNLRSQIAVLASANDTTAHKVVTVQCPAGTTISGGGFATVPSDPGIDVSASNPVGTSGWSSTADVLSLPPGTNWQLLAMAVCVGPA
jgi:hypothetical protein